MCKYDAMRSVVNVKQSISCVIDYMKQSSSEHAFLNMWPELLEYTHLAECQSPKYKSRGFSSAWSVNYSSSSVYSC